MEISTTDLCLYGKLPFTCTYATNAVSVQLLSYPTVGEAAVANYNISNI